MNRKAVFMDIDGTLMQNSVVSEKVINAIKQARGAGHLFFICTGRSKGHLPKLLRDADYIDGYVLSCGMYCEVQGEIIYRELLELENLQKAAHYFCENGYECRFDGEDRMLALNSNRPECTSFVKFEDINREFPKEAISKLTIRGKYRPEYSEFFGDKFTVYDMGGWSDVVKKGVTKATGMQLMLDHVGIPQKDSIGIGDGSNDLPMIKYAGLGVAMGNAPENVKAEADYVTETCDNDGVAVMIEKFLL